jgi:hypothetical protein
MRRLSWSALHTGPLLLLFDAQALQPKRGAGDPSAIIVAPRESGCVMGCSDCHPSRFAVSNEKRGDVDHR